MKQLVGACLVCVALLSYGLFTMLGQIAHHLLTVSKIAIGSYFTNLTFAANASVLIVLFIGLYFWCSKDK